MMLSCLCGGVVEVGLLVALASILSAAFTKWYNRRACRKAQCWHNCDNHGHKR